MAKSNLPLQIVGLPAPVRHALQALSAFVPVRTGALGAAAVARRFRLPEEALSKSLRHLARRGILSSRPGPGGGYSLRAAPEATTLLAVVEALGGSRLRRGRCLLEERACSAGGFCALHEAASEADARMKAVLSRLTLADLKTRSPRKSGPSPSRG